MTMIPKTEGRTELRSVDRPDWENAFSLIVQATMSEVEGAEQMMSAKALAEEFLDQMRTQGHGGPTDGYTDPHVQIGILQYEESLATPPRATQDVIDLAAALALQQRMNRII